MSADTRADHAATVRQAHRRAMEALGADVHPYSASAIREWERQLEAALDALEADLAAYQRSLMAHHEISTLSRAAIRESIGGPCQICARAQAARAALAEADA